MAHVQKHYARRDPWQRTCRTCKHWDGDRTWPTDETRLGTCRVPLPPYLVERRVLVTGSGTYQTPVTSATATCMFHDYVRPGGG